MNSSDAKKLVDCLCDEHLNRKIAEFIGWRFVNGKWWHDEIGDGPPQDLRQDFRAKNSRNYCAGNFGKVKHGPPELCREPRCKNPRRFNRKRKRYDLLVCHKHESRRKRAANRMRAAWQSLKDHAKARGISFRLSFYHFRKFALQTDYLNRTGRNGHCLTVDRINNRRGYYFKNIQPLTRIKNSEKRARQDEIRMKAGYAWKKDK